MPPRMSDQTYSAQRGFTAWIAAIYAFFMMLFGTTDLMIMIMGHPEGATMQLLQASITILLLFPNLFLSTLIWSKVYGD